MREHVHDRVDKPVREGKHDANRDGPDTPAYGKAASAAAAATVTTRNWVRWLRCRSAIEPPIGPPTTLGRTNVIPTAPASKADHPRIVSPYGTTN